MKTKSILWLVFAIMLVCSCKTQKQFIEVPVEKVKIEYVHDVKIDSVFVKDSIDRWAKGDTVFIYKEHTKYKYLYKMDTVVRVDSIPKIVTVETVKEVNKLYGYQKILMLLGILTFSFSLYKIIKKIK